METNAKKRVNGRRCCVPLCDSDSEKDKTLHFYSFPSRSWETERKKKWIVSIHRQTTTGQPWEPTKNSLICSKHFVGNEKSNHPHNEAYNPTIFPWIPKTPLSVERSSRIKKRNQQKESLSLRLESSFARSQTDDDFDVLNDTSLTEPQRTRVIGTQTDLPRTRELGTQTEKVIGTAPANTRTVAVGACEETRDTTTIIENDNDVDNLSYVNEEAETSIKEEQHENFNTSNKRIRHKRKYPETQMISKVYDMLQEETCTRAEIDGDSAFGQHIAAKLSKYSQHTKNKVHHLISNILYDADMGLFEPASTSSQPVSVSIPLSTGTLNFKGIQQR